MDQAYYEQVARQQEWEYELQERKRMDALEVKEEKERLDERLHEAE